MAIYGVEQPELLMVDDKIRLRRYDGVHEFALEWYQDEELVYLVDGVRKPYTMETLNAMYGYLNKQGELYFIEALQGDHYVPIGDVTFWQEDMPIVIGDKNYRGKKVGKKVIETLLRRGKALGYDTMYVGEIYDYNIASRKCFESAGFYAYEKTEKGNKYKYGNYIKNNLSYEDYCKLRTSVGWLNFSEAQTRKSLQNSLYTITVVDQDQTVAMGRLVGDGIYYLVVDVVVQPDYQKKGIGSRILDLLIEYVDQETPENGRSSIQLIAEKGKEAFYLKKGFKQIPHEYCGAGMRKIIRK